MRKTTTFLMTLLVMSLVFCQNQKATTENGKNVILNSDGTWIFDEASKTAQKNLDFNDCTNWIKVVEDNVTGKSYTVIKDNLIVSKDGGKKGFAINLMLITKGPIILGIKAIGAGGCIDKGDKINILFTDGSRLELNSDGDFNCKGNVTVYFGDRFGKKKQLIELQTKKIDIIRVWTNNSYVEEKFDNNQAEQFKNVISCLGK